MKNICPNCNHKEYIGALFCSECGTQIAIQSGVSTQALSSDDAIAGISEDAFSVAVRQPPAEVNKALVSLFFRDTGQTLPLSGKMEFSLGRSSSGQKMNPDIDLTEYDGYRKGVSRLHATILAKQDKVSITDVGSANGTRVNGRKLPAHVAVRLKDGDMVALGQLKIQILIR